MERYRRNGDGKREGGEERGIKNNKMIIKYWGQLLQGLEMMDKTMQRKDKVADQNLNTSCIPIQQRTMVTNLLSGWFTTQHHKQTIILSIKQIERKI